MTKSLWKMQVAVINHCRQWVDLLSHLKSASISPLSPFFWEWGDGSGEDPAVDGSGNTESKLQWVQSLNRPLLPRSF